MLVDPRKQRTLITGGTGQSEGKELNESNKYETKNETNQKQVRNQPQITKDEP